MMKFVVCGGGFMADKVDVCGNCFWRNKCSEDVRRLAESRGDCQGFQGVDP